MSSPIDPLGSAKVLGAPRVAPAKPSRPSSDSSASAGSGNTNGDSVHLTGDALQIHKLAAAVAQSPAVDVKRVAELRQAINNGSYVVDSHAVARKLLAVDGSLS